MCVHTTVPKERPQDTVEILSGYIHLADLTGKGVWWLGVQVWSPAVVPVSVLSACFIVSSLVLVYGVNKVEFLPCTEVHTLTGGDRGIHMLYVFGTEAVHVLAALSRYSPELPLGHLGRFEVKVSNESPHECLSCDNTAPSSRQPEPFICWLLALNFIFVSLILILKDWSCCATLWSSFQSSCYLISTVIRSWNESQKDCAVMGADTVAVNTKDEQEFIIKNLNKILLTLGLSDPEGQRHWQWVDQTPYNKSITFWHSHEPNNPDECCVVINFHTASKQWGWNDVHCHIPQKATCKMMKIYL
ncbi:PREDICTED: uncharacterized protein LOC103601078 [Galeopterus variegatus]|uniref:Uncharacterized protein LOC103601078 n=1 Tax=Galeopterus variegatus TaxID=482537 RepID=A0ABM0RSU1_GALVR|nr:PREDICTED: uncharacterized protein LOC103601078 [Galeopterus variegatus]